LDPRPFRSPPSGGEPATRTIDRRTGRAGDLALRERAGALEIISNGVFLMDTRDGRSERLLVRSALDATRRGRDRVVLLAGLGVGFSLAEALSSPAVAGVTVIEWEPAVVSWNRTLTGARTGGCVDAPRVRCENADLVEWLQRPVAHTFDALCVDVDNGPDWTIHPANGWLYGHHGIAALRRRITDGGVLSVWSASRASAFEQRLQRQFRHVERLEVPVARGEPDVIYLAHD
jgi:spermidine synthase